MPLIASFNHGDYYKGIGPILGLGLSWLVASMLVVVALVCLFVPRSRHLVLPMVGAVWVLTALCFYLHSLTPWHVDANDILITSLPAGGALIVGSIAAFLKARGKLSPPLAPRDPASPPELPRRED